MLSASALCCKMSLLIGQPWNINAKNERKNRNNSNSNSGNMLLKATASNGNGQQWQTVNESSGRFRYEHKQTHQKAKRGAGKGLTDGQGTDCGEGGKLGVRLTHWRDSRVCRLPLCVTISKLHIYAHMALRHAPRQPPPWLTDNINQSYTRVCVSLCVSVCVCVCWRVLIGKLWQQPWEQPQNRRFDWQQALQLAAIMQAGGREDLLWEGRGLA